MKKTIQFHKFIYSSTLAIILTLAACATHEKKVAVVEKTPLPEISVTRVVNGPRDVVWKTWTDAERIKRWWGPKGFSAPVIQNDLRDGGKYLYSMKGPDGKVYWSTGTYDEVMPYARIIATDSFADEKGNVVPPTQYGMPSDFPSAMKVVVLFEEESRGKTRVTVTQSGIPEGPMTEMTKIGWNQSLDKFAIALKSTKK